MNDKQKLAANFYTNFIAEFPGLCCNMGRSSALGSHIILSGNVDLQQLHNFILLDFIIIQYEYLQQAYPYCKWRGLSFFLKGNRNSQNFDLNSGTLDSEEGVYVKIVKSDQHLH